MNTSTIQSEPRDPGTRAREADKLRVQGLHADAIEQFDIVLKEDRGNAWAHAHRGAAKATIFDLEGAIQDFDRAIALHREQGKGYAWAHAHKAEAYRFYSRFYMWRTARAPKAGAPAELQDLLQRAKDCFETALAEQPEYPWASAHYAANFTYQYVVARHVLRQEESEWRPYADKALVQFDLALLGPEYSWAYMFKVFLLTLLNDPRKATGLSDGGLVELDRKLVVLEPLSALRNFEHRYHAAARSGWLKLQEDPHAVIAAYFTASSVAAMHKEGTGYDRATTDKVLRQADAILRHREILSRTLRASLAYQMDRTNLQPIEEAMRQLKASPDLETYVLLNLDSSLEELRDAHPDWFTPPAPEDHRDTKSYLQ